MYLIQDEEHAEQQPGEYASLPEAVAELRRRATIPWDAPPNQAPCISWKTCGRRYVVIECDRLAADWKEIRRIPMLHISSSGPRWLSDPN